MQRFAAWLVVVGCGSAPNPEPQRPPPPPAVAVDAALPPDADVPDEVAAAPAWTFRYNAPGRLETWTLRHAGGSGLVVVEAARGATRYTGAVTDGATLALALASGPAKLALDCKRDKLAVGASCGDARTTKVDVLACYHPDFKSPMMFGAAPGVEYVTTDRCTGYRVLVP